MLFVVQEEKEKQISESEVMTKSHLQNAQIIRQIYQLLLKGILTFLTALAW